MKFAFGLGAIFISLFNLAWITFLIYVIIHFVHKLW